MQCPNCGKFNNSLYCWECRFDSAQYHYDVAPETFLEYNNWLKSPKKDSTLLGFLFLLLICFSPVFLFTNLIMLLPLFLFIIFIAFGSNVNHNQKRVEHIEEAKGKLFKAVKEFEKVQKSKGLIKYVTQGKTVKWGTAEQVKKWKTIDIDLKNNFKSISPRQFEKFIAKLFSAMDYDTTLTSSTGDYGADIIAKKGNDTIVIEVKKYATGNTVGNREIQRLLGSMYHYSANKAIFVTSSDFTKYAYKQASKAPIELWNKNKLVKVIEDYFF